MSTLKISDGVVKDEILVLGLTSTNSKGGIAIEAGDMALDTKTIVSQLVDMGATGKVDEVVKLPGSHVRLLVFTGLGKKSSAYPHEVLRRAAGAASRALSTSFNDRPTKASRPWDRNRDGFVMGEGAGGVVLEEYEHAKKRGAKIYAEILGYGMSGDAHHITSPAEDGGGAFRAMRAALKNSGLSLEDIGYINAHGTSTPAGGVIEVKAMKRLFGDYCYKLAVSSTKSAIGHLLGAAGAVESIFSIFAMQHGIVPPTLNLDEPSEGCDLNFVPHKAQEKKLNYVMSNSFGFGGTNASLIFGKAP